MVLTVILAETCVPRDVHIFFDVVRSDGTEERYVPVYFVLSAASQKVPHYELGLGNR